MSGPKDYEKQRRNTYGESPHSSRRNISRGKRRQNRSTRRTLRQILQDLGEEGVGRLRLVVQRKHRFKKQADEPLGTVLVRELVRDYVMGRVDTPGFASRAEKLQESYRGFRQAYNQAFEWFSHSASSDQLVELQRYR